MFTEKQEIQGHLIVYRMHDGFCEKLVDKHNTIWNQLNTNLRTVLISRSVEYGVDAIAWGSFNAAGGTFVDNDYAGTTSYGTQGALLMSAVGSQSAKFSGTFSFAGAKQINYFELGRGYTPAGAGVTQMFTGRYAYDSSLLTGSTYLTYQNGDSLIVDWTLQIGV